MESRAVTKPTLSPHAIGTTPRRSSYTTGSTATLGPTRNQPKLHRIWHKPVAYGLKAAASSAALRRHHDPQPTPCHAFHALRLPPAYPLSRHHHHQFSCTPRPPTGRPWVRPRAPAPGQTARSCRSCPCWPGQSPARGRRRRCWAWAPACASCPRGSPAPRAR